MIQLLTHIKKIAVNKWTALLVILFIATIVTSYFVVGYSSKKLIYQNVSKLPNADVALVLGTSRYTATGYANLFFKYRIKAAVDLYKTGKVKHIIVSGDNSLFEYNEPREMRRALVREGIPIEAITLDFAGFRTLDSVVRCKEVFGQNNFIIISQEFHVARALFIAKKFNISAIGYAAQSPP
ncbi:MAG: YdcF family protein, partial [Flavobacteriales bacterium]|nr:YdcF family protein [Flavobacteriales bacterium]